jgi:methylenetetrahydrofolate dehydrogenase (NADP+)/methenyltetrahydrofolate cyclohydrolase
VASETAAPAVVIDGKAIAARVREDVARDVAAFTARTGMKPGLATILVGDDPASAVYVAGKQRSSREVGIDPFDHRLPASAPQSDVEELIARLNADASVHGILCQLPVPDHMDGVHLTGLIDPG